MQLKVISDEAIQSNPNLTVGGKDIVGTTPEGVPIFAKPSPVSVIDTPDAPASVPAPWQPPGWEGLDVKSTPVVEGEPAPWQPPGWEGLDVTPVPVTAETPVPAPVVEAIDIDQVGVVEDTGKSIISAIPKGVSNLLGMPGEISATVDQMVGKLQAMPEKEKKKVTSILRQAKKKGHPWLKDVDVESIIDKVQPERVMPTVGETRKAIEKVTGDLYEPKTTAGKIAGKGVEFATEALLGGGVKKIIQNTIGGFTAGVGSEIAGQAAEGTEWEGVSRLVGAIVAGPLVGISKTFGKSVHQAVKGRKTGRARSILHSLTKDATDADFDAALKLQKEAADLGIPLRGDEALGIAKLKSAGIEVAYHDKMTQFAAKRKGMIEKIGKTEASKIGDAVAPTEIAGLTKEQAKAYIKNKDIALKQGYVTPHYTAAKGETAPPSVAMDFVRELKKIRGNPGGSNYGRVNQLIKDLSKTISVKDPSTGKSMKVTQYETDVGKLNDAYKQYRDTFVVKPNTTDVKIKGLGPKINPVIKQFGDDIATISPNIKKGREMHAKIQSEIMEPLRKSLVGKLDGDSKQFEQLSKILLDPYSARPGQIRGALRRISQADKSLPGKFARLHVEHTLDKALRTSEPGHNFVKNVIGTDLQRDNMKAMLDAVDIASGIPKGTRFKSLEKVARVFKSMAERVAKDPSLSNEARRDSTISSIIGIANFGRGGLAGQLQRGMATARQERTFSGIAEILTSDDSLKQLQALSKIDVKSYNKMRSAVIGLLIAGSQEATKNGN